MIPSEIVHHLEVRRLTTPRSAALAGILFAILFSSSIVLIRIALPTDLRTNPDWMETGVKRIELALKMMPFAGITFLWLIGVVRDKLGEFEDKFFFECFLRQQPDISGYDFCLDGHRWWHPFQRQARYPARCNHLWP